MNAKEKANELIEKYLNTIINFLYIDTEDGRCIRTGYMTHNSAVRCAINAVDEMIIQNGELYLLGLAKDYYIEENAYLFDVKSELQSL